MPRQLSSIVQRFSSSWVYANNASVRENHWLPSVASSASYVQPLSLISHYTLSSKFSWRRPFFRRPLGVHQRETLCRANRAFGSHDRSKDLAWLNCIKKFEQRSNVYKSSSTHPFVHLLMFFFCFWFVNFCFLLINFIGVYIFFHFSYNVLITYDFSLVKKLVCIFKCFFGTYFYFIFSRFYLLLLISLEF